MSTSQEEERELLLLNSVSWSQNVRSSRVLWAPALDGTQDGKDQLDRLVSTLQPRHWIVADGGTLLVPMSADIQCGGVTVRCACQRLTRHVVLMVLVSGLRSAWREDFYWKLSPTFPHPRPESVVPAVVGAQGEVQGEVAKQCRRNSRMAVLAASRRAERRAYSSRSILSSAPDPWGRERRWSVHWTEAVLPLLT